MKKKLRAVRTAETQNQQNSKAALSSPPICFSQVGNEWRGRGVFLEGEVALLEWDARFPCPAAPEACETNAGDGSAPHHDETPAQHGNADESIHTGTRTAARGFVPAASSGKTTRTRARNGTARHTAAGYAAIAAFYKELAEQTGVGIAPEMLAKLARRHENLKYFKIECRPPGSYLSALKELLPEGREIFIGNAGFQMIEGFARGAAGVMPGPSMPDVYRAVWDALLAGNDAEARRIHGVLNAMLNHIRQNVEMIIFFEKRILKRRGFIRSDFCRTPAFRTDRIYDSIFDTLYEELRREFREAGNGKL